jgi:hypothetical protein
MYQEIYKGDDHPDIAVSFNNIGNALSKLGRHEEALKSYQESLRIKIRIYNGDFNKISTREVNIIQLLIYMSVDNKLSYEQAIKYQEELETLFPEDINIKLNLAGYYHIQACIGNKESYLTYFNKAKEMFEKALNSTTQKNANLYVEYGMFLFKHHKPDNVQEYGEIKQLLEQAVALKGDISSLSYSSAFIKEILIEPLQKFANNHNKLTVKPNILAYYMLVKLHKMHNHETKAKQVLTEFTKIPVSEADKGILSLLLQDINEEENSKSKQRSFLTINKLLLGGILCILGGGLTLLFYYKKHWFEIINPNQEPRSTIGKTLEKTSENILPHTKSSQAASYRTFMGK